MATLEEVLAQRYPDTPLGQLRRGAIPGLQGSAGGGMRNIMNLTTLGAPTSPFVGPQQVTGEGFRLVGGPPTPGQIPLNRSLVPIPQPTQGAYTRVTPGGYSLLNDKPLSAKALSHLKKLSPYARSLGPYGLLATLGLGAYSMVGDEPLTDEGLNLKIQEAAQYSWGKRALDPSTPTTENNETVRTAHDKHSKRDTWIVYPTIRSVDGKLKKFGHKEAKVKAESIGDYISFNSEEDALRFSQTFSSAISNARDRERNIGLLT